MKNNRASIKKVDKTIPFLFVYYFILLHLCWKIKWELVQTAKGITFIFSSISWRKIIYLNSEKLISK